MPFEDDSAPLKPSKSGLKINNNNSNVPSTAAANNQRAVFEQRADSAHASTEKFKERALELGQKFIKLINDQTLPSNKTVIDQKLDSEVLSDLVKYAVEVNNDPNQDEGMGSVGIIVLLLKAVVVQRDRLNKLEYELAQLKRKSVESNDDNKR